MKRGLHEQSIMGGGNTEAIYNDIINIIQQLQSGASTQQKPPWRVRGT